MTTSHLKTLALSALTLLILLLMILWMAGAFHSKIEPETLPELSAYQSPTLTVERVTLPAYEKATGTLEATQAGDISAQIQARIKAIHAHKADVAVCTEKVDEDAELVLKKCYEWHHDRRA